MNSIYFFIFVITLIFIIILGYLIHIHKNIIFILKKLREMNEKMKTLVPIKIEYQSYMD